MQLIQLNAAESLLFNIENILANNFRHRYQVILYL